VKTAIRDSHGGAADAESSSRQIACGVKTRGRKAKTDTFIDVVRNLRRIVGAFHDAINEKILFEEMVLNDRLGRNMMQAWVSASRFNKRER